MTALPDTVVVLAQTGTTTSPVPVPAPVDLSAALAAAISYKDQAGAYASYAAGDAARAEGAVTTLDGALASLNAFVDTLNAKQPLDATLTALAALVTAADQLIYATGADTFAMASLTAFARTILDDVDAAAVRATIFAQPLDATLTALAGVTTAANQLIYVTGADAFATTALTAYARSLLDDTDAAAARATLGVSANGGSDDFMTTGKLLQGAPSVAVGGSQQYIQSHRAGAAGASFVRYSADIYGPDIRIAKSRSSTIGTPGAAVQAGDTLGTINFIADDGTDLASAAASISAEAAATATAGSVAADLVLWTVPSGTTRSERLRVTSTGNIQVGGANTVISAARHILLRSYTVATLPSASPAAQMIYVSNGTSNKRLAISDGTSWRWPDGAVVS